MALHSAHWLTAGSVCMANRVRIGKTLQIAKSTDVVVNWLLENLSVTPFTVPLLPHSPRAPIVLMYRVDTSRSDIPSMYRTTLIRLPPLAAGPTNTRKGWSAQKAKMGERSVPIPPRNGPPRPSH